MTTKETLQFELTTLPDAIKEQETKLFTLMQQKEQCEQKIEAIETQTQNKVIEMSQMEELKAQLSNELKRKKKLIDLLKSNKEYVDAANLMMATKQEIQKLEIECRHNDRRFKAARVIALLISNN